MKAEEYPEELEKGGRTILCACCVFREDCRVYRRCLHDGYYQYRTWEEYHLQHRKCREGMRLWEEADWERRR
jgi:hypothetical protein